MSSALSRRITRGAIALLLQGAALTASLSLTTAARAQPTEPPTPEPSPSEPDAPPAPRPSEDETVHRTQATPPSGARSEQSPGQIGTSDVEGATTSPANSTSSPKRAMPDYDGRGEPKTTAGDVALWVPRVIFSPVYFVTEFMIRRPLGWFITTAEQKQWPTFLRDFFLFGPDKKAGVVPTAFLDFGFRPSFGVYAFWDDLLGKGNHLRLHATTFGKSWLQGAVADKIPLGKDGFVDLRFEGVHRPDLVFYGIGPRSLQPNETRFGVDRLQAHPVFEMRWWKGSRVTTEAGFKYVNFRDDSCCEDPSLSTAINNGTMPAPPGYATGYSSVYQRGELTIDSRDERPASQTGFRVELEAEHGSNVRRSTANWVRYGGSVGGFLDIKNNRVVSLAVTTLFVDPISSGAEIPFTEQIVLGGSGPMRGYLYGRLVDRSAAIATLKYRWPIWVFLDGTLQVATGNVFGPQLEDFKTKLLRLSSAIGVESVGGADHTFEFLAGFGTETFSEGTQIRSFRLLFGTNRGF